MRRTVTALDSFESDMLQVNVTYDGCKVLDVRVVLSTAVAVY